MTTDTAAKPGLGPRTRVFLWGGTAALLAVPAVAMQISTEVNWGLEDFVTAAILLGSTGLALEGAGRGLVTSGKRMLAALVIIGALLLAWAELAVGVFD